MAIGWGFIGTGRHPDARVAPAMVLAEDTEIIAAYSRSQERAEDFASKHGARSAYSSVEALLADSRVHAVFIASPNHLHAPYAKLAAQAGKHVFVEKPMATTVSECLDIIKACKAHGVKLGVGFQLRFHPGHLVLQRQFREGCGVMPAWRRGAWHGSVWPVRYCPAYPQATAATRLARTVPGAAFPAPPGRPAAS